MAFLICKSNQIWTNFTRNPYPHTVDQITIKSVKIKKERKETIIRGDLLSYSEAMGHFERASDGTGLDSVDSDASEDEILVEA